MTLPKIYNYGSSTNYGAHTMRMDLDCVTVWFSYTTPIAFHVQGYGRVVHENIWSRTTGKHLNLIDGDQSSRVDSKTFARLWREHMPEKVELNLKETSL